MIIFNLFGTLIMALLLIFTIVEDLNNKNPKDKTFYRFLELMFLIVLFALWA